MKYIDEYREPALVEGLLRQIHREMDMIARPVGIMEVCGTHTMAISRCALRDLLPGPLRLISGPGCPVCVTSVEDVDRALSFAGIGNVMFVTFGDMLRVPGTERVTLQRLRADGCDVRIISSPRACLSLAERNPGKNIIFMGIGFETTAPAVASLILTASARGLQNLSVFSVHKVIPPAMKMLLDDPVLCLDGFLCPGHVSIVIGGAAYGFIPGAGAAAVIAGFEPVDVLEGIMMILRQIRRGERKVEIQYARAVREEGNPRAREIMYSVFEPCDASWRGLGVIEASGLALRDEFRTFDTRRRFPLPEIRSKEEPGCACGSILKGVMTPGECPLFEVRCTPEDPLGPCMVSSEGTCAAYYTYRRGR